MSGYQTPERRRASFKRFFLRIMLILVILLIVAAGSLVAFYKANLKAVGGGSGKVFVIAEGLGTAEIAQQLKENGLIKNVDVFRWYVRLNGSLSLKAGTYQLNSDMDVPALAAVLSEGKVSTDLVTILPGKRIKQIREELINSGYDVAAVDRALNPSLYGSHPVFAGFTLPPNLEGFLYPDTYFRSQIDSPEEVIRLALDEMAEALTSEVRTGIQAQGLSLYDGLKLASIVEREVSASNPDDRPRAAQVFLKRLQLGMMLQSNTTDNLPDEFDTYSIAGLPPEPISNVTATSLAAVANPAKTDFLYFVSGKDCVTRFSSTDTQHEALKSQFGIATEDDQCR